MNSRADSPGAMNSRADVPGAMDSNAILSCHQLGKTFHEGGLVVDVLKDINLSVARGERVAIVGSSGAGKSTLLHLLGGLDTPSRGEVWVNNQNMARLNEVQRGRLRNQSLGFIYQFHHLLPEFTALENVAMPLLIRGLSPAKAAAEARVLLENVGLGARLAHKPGELSGGEQQRVAVGRAIINNPAVVLADEPSGKLDSESKKELHKLFFTLRDKFNQTFVVVTHDMELAGMSDRKLTIHDGRMTK